MAIYAIVSMLAVSCLLLLLVLFRMRKLSTLAGKETDLSPVLNDLNKLQAFQVQADRSAHDEFSRNRQEQTAQSQGLRSEVVSSLTGIGDSLSTKIEVLTRSNDQKLELLRSGVEQRLESFTTESSRKSDGLSEFVVASSTKLRDEVSTKLAEFKTSLDTTVKETQTLQGKQTETISGTIRVFQSDVEDKQLRLQTTIDTKLTTVAEQTAESLSKMETSLRTQAQQLREETGTSFKNLGDSIMSTLTAISQMQQRELNDIRNTVDNRLVTIQADNETKLEQMRQTVDEKLQGTLEARLGESFKQVSERLEQVYTGLGEMKTLATGVGDLKRVLTNVKIRGTWGEGQLGAIIEEILAPDQFSKNVATSGTGERVEYAVKLPGRDSNGEPVWLPIDAKFPVEDYDRLIEASERGDVEAVDKASRQLEATLRLCARNLSEKYLVPPSTTDFGVLFLSTEGLYAEAMRRPGLADSIQREYRVVLSGPSTLAALLNALQMGFRTLAIQKRSSEVWEILGSIKTEFGKYAGILAKVKKKLNEAQNTIDKAETRTRAIQRKLRKVEGPEDLQLAEETQAVAEGLDETPVLAGGEEEVCAY